MALAPRRSLLGVPSNSIIVRSITACWEASRPTSTPASSSSTLATAFITPLPLYTDESPSRSSSASNAPVLAPEGTAARPTTPDTSPTSTSTVGCPRESRIWRAWTRAICDIGSPGLGFGLGGRVYPPGMGAPAMPGRRERVNCMPSVEVVYGRIESPAGPLFAAASSRGLMMLAYRDDDEEPPGDGDPAVLDQVRRQLEEYFAGERREFDLPLDWTLVRGFARAVLEAPPPSPTGRRAPTGRSRPRRAARGRSAPPATRSAATRSPSSSPATGWSPAAAASAATAAGSAASACCWTWRARRPDTPRRALQDR